MRIIDFIKVAFRNLWRRKLRTFLTIIAVVVGATAVVSLLSIALGARNVFLSQLESIGALTKVTVFRSKDVEIDPFSGGRGDDIVDEDAPKLNEELIDGIKALDYVVAVSRSAYVHQFQSVQLEGQDKYYQFDAQSVDANEAGEVGLQAGTFFETGAEKNEVILGASYVERFDFDDTQALIGKTVSITTYEGYQGIEFELPSRDAPEEEWKKRKIFIATIRGVGLPGPEEHSSFITTAWAERIYTEHHYGDTTEEAQKEWDEYISNLENEYRRRGEEVPQEIYDRGPEPSIETYNEIEENGWQNLVVKIDDADNVEAVAQNIEDNLGVGAVTAQEFLEGILRIFTIIEAVLAAIGGIALLVAAIGIINTMVMAIYERTREIGVMKAVGASKGTIRILFTLEAALLGFWGGILGVLAGWGLSLLTNYFAQRQLSSEGFALENIITLPWWLSLSVVGFTTIIGLLAGLYPAARAARLDPVDALHKE